jgi:hypothetical protein
MVDGGVKAPEHVDRQRAKLSTSPRPHHGENNLRGTLHLAENTVPKAKSRSSSKFSCGRSEPASHWIRL